MDKDAVTNAPAGYHWLAMTAHGWASGKPLTDPASTVKRLRSEWGSEHMKKHGYVLYLIHPDTEISSIDGRMEHPIDCSPIKVDDQRPVKWERDGDQHVGKLPGDKEVRITEWRDTPLGRQMQIHVVNAADGKPSGITIGGGDDRDLLKRAKAKAEEFLKA